MKLNVKVKKAVLDVVVRSFDINTLNFRSYNEFENDKEIVLNATKGYYEQMLEEFCYCVADEVFKKKEHNWFLEKNNMNNSLQLAEHIFNFVVKKSIEFDVLE